MNIQAIVVLVVTVLWFIFCQQWYVCHIKDACGPDIEQVESPEVSGIAPEGEVRPIVFRYNEALPLINDTAFLTFKNRLLEGEQENNYLEIEGQYFTGETPPEGFENLGRARAANLQALFSEFLPEDRIHLKSRRINTEDDLQGRIFEATQLFWIEEAPVDSAAIAADTTSAAETDTSASAGGVDKEPEEKIVELEDRILIYHLYGSTKRTVDPSVDNYLDRLAQRVSQTGERIQLTGHTDNKGGEQYNQELGLARANYIKRVLLKKGVPEKQISAQSEGESKPLTSNESDEGRAQNRRTEVLLIKN